MNERDYIMIEIQCLEHHRFIAKPHDSFTKNNEVFFLSERLLIFKNYQVVYKYTNIFICVYMYFIFTHKYKYIGLFLY